MPSVSNHFVNFGAFATMEVAAILLLAIGASATATAYSHCPGSCSGRGVCGSAGCLCIPGWAGRGCEIRLTSQVVPAAVASQPPRGFSLSYLNQHVAPSIEALACADGCSAQGGTCVGGVCVCREGFYGPTCTHKSCANDCWRHGVCETGGLCRCDVGWSGKHCEFRVVERGVAAQAKSMVALPQLQAAAPQSQDTWSPSWYRSWDHGDDLVKDQAAPPQVQAAAPHPQEAFSPSRELLPLRGAHDQVSAMAQRAQNVLQSVRQLAQRRTTERDAARRIEKAVAEARSHSAELPGHEFAKPEEENRDAAFVSLRQGATGANSAARAACSGRGVLNATTGVCNCQAGWIGDQCETPACENDCGTNGLCLAGHCICDTGFYGSSCQHVRCPSDCSGNGYCWGGRCYCSGDYGGDACDVLFHSSKVLAFKLPSGHAKSKGIATAQMSTIRAVHSTNTCAGNCSGHGACGKSGVCTCDTDWFGLACESYCPNSCSAHGECVHGSCLCDAGWSGSDCSTMGDCSGHGKLNAADVSASADANLANQCICDDGWSGDDCSLQLVCPDPLCSGHGACANTGQCLCSAGWSGLMCEISSPPCEGLCGDHGTCDVLSSTCDCERGWSGPRCSIQLWSCPNSCGGHGTCVDGFCSCDPGYDGEDCSTLRNSDLILPRPNCSEEADILLLEDGSAPNPCAKRGSLAELDETPHTSDPADGDAIEALLAKAKMRMKTLGPSTASWLPSYVAPAAAAPASPAVPVRDQVLPPARFAGQFAEPEDGKRDSDQTPLTALAGSGFTPVAQRPMHAGASVAQTLEAASATPSSSSVSQLSLLDRLLDASSEAAINGVKANMNVLSRLAELSGNEQPTAAPLEVGYPAQRPVAAQSLRPPKP